MNESRFSLLGLLPPGHQPLEALGSKLNIEPKGYARRGNQRVELHPVVLARVELLPEQNTLVPRLRVNGERRWRI